MQPEWKAFEAPAGHVWSLITVWMSENEKEILACDVRKKRISLTSVPDLLISA